jgi:hypothetical protein
MNQSSPLRTEPVVRSEAPTALDATPYSVTLPAYAWAALRGAARKAARGARRASEARRRCLTGLDLDAHRAQTLGEAVAAIDGVLRPRDEGEVTSRPREKGAS